MRIALDTGRPLDWSTTASLHRPGGAPDHFHGTTGRRPVRRARTEPVVLAVRVPRPAPRSGPAIPSQTGSLLARLWYSSEIELGCGRYLSDADRSQPVILLHGQ